MRATIEEERPYASRPRAARITSAQYKRYVARYDKDKKYQSELASYRKLERELQERSKSEFGFTSSLTNFSKKFTVTLKNGRSVKARLVKVSKDHDLALLKLDNCDHAAAVELTKNARRARAPRFSRSAVRSASATR